MEKTDPEQTLRSFLSDPIEHFDARNFPERLPVALSIAQQYVADTKAANIAAYRAETARRAVEMSFGFLWVIIVMTIVAWLVGCAAPRSVAAPRAEDAQGHAAVKVEVFCITRLSFDEGSFRVSGGFGSGVAVGPRHVLTAEHVVRCPVMAIVELTTWDGRKLRASVERTDPKLDLARLAVVSGALDASAPAVGVVAVGHRVCSANGYPTRGQVCGDVSSISTGGEGRNVEAAGFKVRHGNSGAGVYNARGQLVGITTHMHFCSIEDYLDHTLNGTSKTGCSGGFTSLAGRGWLP